MSRSRRRSLWPVAGLMSLPVSEACGSMPLSLQVSIMLAMIAVVVRPGKQCM
jgi:hypothetical protein